MEVNTRTIRYVRCIFGLWGDDAIPHRLSRAPTVGSSFDCVYLLLLFLMDPLLIIIIIIICHPLFVGQRPRKVSSRGIAQDSAMDGQIKKEKVTMPRRDVGDVALGTRHPRLR